MKKITNNIAALSLLFLSYQAHSQIQCAQDIVINEGGSISMCDNAMQTISGTAGFVSYNWTGPETVSGQSITPNFSGQYILAAEDGVGCVSEDTIIVTINTAPNVVILSSEGNPLCSVSGGTVLSTQDSYLNYNWNTGATSATVFTSTAQSYSVDVIDENGCTGSGSITLTAFNFGLDVNQNAFCSGGTTSLEAIGGGTYLWSTGETGSVIVVDPDVTTTYTVDISAGGCTETLSAEIEPTETLDFEMPDTLYLSVGDVEIINGPTGFTSYLWVPGDNIDNPIAQSAVYHANYSEMVVLNADYQGLCNYTDSVYILVVDLNVPGGFSPNGDLKNQYFVIPELNFLDGSLTVWNRWGDLVFEADHYENNWAGTCEAGLCLGDGPLPEGTYFYEIVVEEQVKRGYLTIKR